MKENEYESDDIWEDLMKEFSNCSSKSTNDSENNTSPTEQTPNKKVK